MPLTFPSHLAPVLPLKLWRPRWFDGVALSTGAVAPDVAYLFTGSRFDVGARAHTLAGLVWWCLPVALGYAWVVRRSIAGVAVHLPDSPTFAWRDYAALGVVRHPWWITVSSALLGAASHVGWDRVTHSDGWLRALGVDWYATTGVHWWTFSDVQSTVLGALVVVWLARRAGRKRQIFDGVPPALPPARPGVFWTTAALVVLVGQTLLPTLPAASLLTPAVVRLLHLAALALVLGALVVGLSSPGGRTTGSEEKQRQTH